MTFTVTWQHAPGVVPVAIFTFAAKDPDEAQRIANDVIPRSVHRTCKVVAKESLK